MYYIDENLVPIFAIAVALIIAVVSIITRYRLRVEQIRADALVRAEEVRTRNQLELEKLLRKDGVPSHETSAASSNMENNSDEGQKSKSRVRE